MLDYHLGHDVQGTVTLEIHDAAGGLVRRVSSADPPAYTPGDLALELVPLYWVRQPQTLPHSAGWHRWVWDLRYPTPRTAQRGFPIAAIPGDTPQTPQGPFVTAGTYRVRLTVGAQHWEQPLVIRIDPRLIVSDSDLSAQLQLARNLAAALDASTGALLEARSLRAQAQELAAHRDPSASPNIAVALERYMESLRQLLGPEGGVANDGDLPRDLAGLNRDLASLYDQVIRADAAPTSAQAAAATVAMTEWQSLQPGWQELRDAQTTALNLKLRAAHRPPLRPELAPPKDLDMADRD